MRSAGAVERVKAGARRAVQGQVPEDVLEGGWDSHASYRTQGHPEGSPRCPQAGPTTKRVTDKRSMPLIVGHGHLRRRPGPQVRRETLSPFRLKENRREAVNGHRPPRRVQVSTRRAPDEAVKVRVIRGIGQEALHPDTRGPLRRPESLEGDGHVGEGPGREAVGLRQSGRPHPAIGGVTMGGQSGSQEGLRGVDGGA